MKNILVFFCCILFLEDTKAQAPASFYLNLNDPYATCHFTNSNIYFSALGMLIKTDYSGNVIWSKVGSFNNMVADDNSIYALMQPSGNLICKFDSSGNTIWARDISASVCPLQNGNINQNFHLFINRERVYITSYQYGAIGGYQALLTLDTTGNIIGSWCDLNASTVSVGNISLGVGSTQGGWLVLGHGGVGIEQTIVKIKMDGTVDTTSTVEIDMGQSVNVEGILEFPDSTYLAFCNVFGMGNGYMGLSKFNENRSVIWQEKLISLSDTSTMLYGTTRDSLGNIYLIAFMTDANTFQSTITIKINNSGVIVFVKEWSDPMIFASIKPIGLFYKSGKICCFVNYQEGAQNYPAIIAFDTSFTTCNIPYNVFTITATPDFISNGIWNSYQSTNYVTFNNTFSTVQALNPVTKDLCQALSAKDVLDEEIVEIFPNPFADKFNVHVRTYQNYGLNIFNLIGEKFFEKEITGDQEIDLQNLPAGVYILNVKSESKSWNRKMIKM